MERKITKLAAQWFVSLMILLMIVFPLGDSKEYLMGAITVDKMNSNGEIEAITFHFKDFPYDVTTGCHLSSKNVDKDYDGPTRTAYQTKGYWEEEIDLGDQDSPFAVLIRETGDPTNRSDYINELAAFCSSHHYIRGITGSIGQLARENTTIGLAFYPKIIDGKTCTLLEYTGLLTLSTKYYREPTNVVALFMPLNETKEGCDRWLMLCSGNQTADWLDSVKVSKINTTMPQESRRH